MDGDEGEISEERAKGRKRNWLPRLGLSLLGLVAIITALVWFSREEIADDFIAAQLEELGLPASYDIERIGGTRQVLTNIVIGDPGRPDMTIERVEIRIVYRWGTPRVGRITLTRPRLYGSYRGGELSFGSLDRVLFRDTGEPAGLPELDITLNDGRALIETDFGPVGVKANGQGPIDNGFSGIIAATAPELEGGGCALRGATLYGTIVTDSGRPRFEGPVRFADLSCLDSDVRIRSAAIQLEAVIDEDFGGIEADSRFSSDALASNAGQIAGSNGTLRAIWRDGRVNARYNIAARGLATEQADMALITVEGALRSLSDFDRLQIEAEIEGNGVRLGEGLDRTLASFASNTQGTLFEPILRRIRARLAAEGRGSALAANLTYRQTDGVTSIVLPQAILRGGSGDTLLSISRGQYSSAGTGTPRFSGNVSTGGQGLPRIVGRVERGPGGDMLLRLRMAEYSADGASLAVPELLVTQREAGSIAFAGRALASGPLPGGSTRNLLVPISGTWSSGGGLALWRECIEVRFDRLVYADLALERRGLTLCPQRGEAIVRNGAAGLRIAAGAPSLDVAGLLGETLIAIRSGPVGFAWPGTLSARSLDIALGPAATATRFHISNLDAELDGEEIAGTFEDADVFLDAVPLDVLDASGDWRYAGGRLTLENGTFRLEDREEPDRFYPVFARNASLSLEDNLITADAALREDETDRFVTTLDIVHDLETGTGLADLEVPGLLFDESLQPADLTRLALGVVANVRGVVTGTGRIAWNATGVTSTGSFSSEDLDFAAAFGPVQGASGTVEFVDLFGLTTAPGQRIRVASVNPGIEVTDGEVVFSLRDGELLTVEGAMWPFMGGTLTLREVNLNLGISEERRYVFEISGLDAGVFVDQLGLGNISATGIFDGSVPIIFDVTGTGRIEGGTLLSRPPGGNVSYVGELTYEDLSPIANFAFDALRWLDYTQMRILMDGNLTGELVTRVRFDGVTQGAGARSNFITRRIASLPIRFNVNISASFYQLITSIRAMYDPAFVRDPRELGLVSDDGTRLRPQVVVEPDDIEPAETIPDEPSIQTPASENTP